MEINESIGGSDGDVEDGDPRIQLVLRNIVDERSADFRHWFNRNNCCARVDRRTQDSIQPAIGAEVYETTGPPKLVQNVIGIVSFS